MFVLSDSHQIKWNSNNGRHQSISLVPLKRGALAGKKIFAMGSCFAVEIRHRLTKLGYDVYPKYFDLSFDPKKVSVGHLPEYDNVNHYSIRSMLQEFENLNEDLYKKELFYDLTQSDNATKKIKRFVRSILSSNKRSFNAGWQDPFRKHVYAENLDSLTEVSEAITEKIRDGAAVADVFIFTLGMSEIWQDKKSGLAICNSYGGDVDEHLCEFVDASFQDIKQQIFKLVKLVRKINPAADIVFSVSPVPLNKTYKEDSVVVANSLSKAKQRVAVDEICCESENAFYFPSYELSLDDDFFEGDGRHVCTQKVEHIVKSFVEWYEGSD